MKLSRLAAALAFAALTLLGAGAASAGGRLHLGQPMPPLAGATGFSFSTTLATTERQPLYSLISTALATKPAGNVITVSAPSTNPFFVVQAPRFNLGDHLLGPGAGWTGAGDSGFASWLEDGISKSGVPPPDAGRTLATDYTGNARPIMVAVTPWGQRFRGQQAFCVDAHALVSDADADPAEGIAKVRFYAEGAYLDVTTRQVYYYQDGRGVWRGLEGFCITLDAPTYLAAHSARPGNTGGSTGNGHWEVSVFARGFAKDGTFDTQLLGIAKPAGTPTTAEYQKRIVFYPDDTDYHLRMNITPSAGADTVATDPATGKLYATPTSPTYTCCTFRTLEDGLRFAEGLYTVGGINAGVEGALPALLTVTETAFFDPYSINPAFNGLPGWTTITAAPGVTATIGRTSWTNHGNTRAVSSVSASTLPASGLSPVTIAGVDDTQWRTGVGGLHFQGITFDFGKLFGIARPTPHSLDWDDAVAHVNSYTGDDYTKLNIDHDHGQEGQLGDFVTEGTFTAGSIADVAVLTRNNYILGAFDDLFSRTPAVIGNINSAMDNAAFSSTINVIRVDYTGANSTAGISTSGSGLNTTVTISDGATTFGPSPTFSALGDTTAGLYGWLTTQGATNFTFTQLVTNNDKSTDRALAPPAGGNAYLSAGVANIGASAGSHTANMTSAMSLHTDWYQYSALAFVRNTLVRNNMTLNIANGSISAFRMDANAYEVAFVNNVVRNTATFIGGALWVKSSDHVLLDHNALGDFTQPNDEENSNQWSATARDQMRASITPALAWAGRDGTLAWAPTANPIWKDNHWISAIPVNGTITPAAGHTGTETVIGNNSGALGHTFDSLFANAAAGDFTPAAGGDLMDVTTWVQARTKFDIYGNLRPAIGPKGPAAPRVTSATYTDAQIGGVALESVLATHGATGTFAAQWHAGAGETGPLTTVTVTGTIN